MLNNTIFLLQELDNGSNEIWDVYKAKNDAINDFNNLVKIKEKNKHKVNKFRILKVEIDIPLEELNDRNVTPDDKYFAILNDIKLNKNYKICEEL